MKITIDTKEDSPEEIRKLIRMLAAMIGEGASDYGQRSEPAATEGLFDMFGDPAASTSEQQQLGDSGGSAGSSGAGGAVDINEFLDKGSSSEQKPSGNGEDEDLRVVPY